MRRACLILVMSLLICPGCFSRYVHIPSRHPVYDLPEKAVVAKVTAAELEPLTTETKMKVVSTVTGLKSEAAQLRALLESYNTYAKKQNDEYDKRFREPEKKSFWDRLRDK